MTQMANDLGVLTASVLALVLSLTVFAKYQDD